MDAGPAARDTVLILEDDPGIRRLQRRHLERLGFHALEASTLAEASRDFDLHRPDILVLDYQLADGETGLEFYRSLQEQGHDVPAILVTGFTDEARILEAMRTGVRDFLPKTANFVELLPPIVENVMKQVRQERRLAEAEAASRAKDHFLATLSHELRTPLTPVLALLHELREDARLPAEVRDDIETMHRNVTLEARLIDDLLDLTRISRGKLEVKLVPLDLRPMLEQTLKSACGSDATDKGVGCKLDLAPGPHTVNGDAARLTQVIWNLLQNAIKFTPAGGTIELRSRLEPAPETRMIVVEIQDSGIGIDPEVLPGIFESFEQGGRAITQHFGGLGLGLSISRSIVQAHGGSLTAASVGSGRGATFTVRLPLCAAEDRPVSGSVTPSAVPGATTGPPGAHLLLVEDHHDSAEVLARILRRDGFQVTHVSGVADARAVMETSAAAGPGGNPIHLVISDLGLPDGTGIELMTSLREHYDVPAIALSGFGMEEDVRRATEAGFARHFTKPVDLKELLQQVRQLLAEQPKA